MRRATRVRTLPQNRHWISIHALHEESDFLCVLFYYHAVVFQSTLSMRRATRVRWLGCVRVCISIHALHEESDITCGVANKMASISIHALHEESDHPIPCGQDHHDKFQSTLSMRRATGISLIELTSILISIHALHEESDPRQSSLCRSQSNFNPRSP